MQLTSESRINHNFVTLSLSEDLIHWFFIFPQQAEIVSKNVAEAVFRDATLIKVEELRGKAWWIRYLKKQSDNVSQNKGIANA
ncbi:MAG: hypothetical protein GY792_25120 [Gammaproteobacteria bacterium]|nr:hypothetical protein [Gammaproteobacteria bacterium]